jgi:hypothetical protein
MSVKMTEGGDISNQRDLLKFVIAHGFEEMSSSKRHLVREDLASQTSKSRYI